MTKAATNYCSVVWFQKKLESKGQTSLGKEVSKQCWARLSVLHVPVLAPLQQGRAGLSW